jgi:endonuclease/exonuclease/phosphatase family metal-dependent hydrolase
MTWNVENLFRPGGMAGVTDPALYEQKLENLASMITKHRPDVIGLQEIGDPGALDDLKAKLGASYPHVLVTTHFDAMHPIRVAALLRRGIRPTERDELINFPVGALTDVPQASGPLTAMGRGALAFTAAIAGESVRVVVMHLKSKLLKYPGGRFQPKDENERARVGGFALLRRAAEAVAVRVWANAWLQAHPGGPLISVGDLNDGPDAATTQILYGPPNANLNRPDKGDPWRLINLARFLPTPDTAFSRVYKGRGELIDHILASTNLARRNVEVTIDTTHVTSIGDQPSQRRRAVWPDHAPVIASIT